MKKIATFLFISVLVLAMVLVSGCGTTKYKSTIKVYNWGDYIDQDVIREFEKKHEIRVIYEEFATNEDMYVKLSAGGADYDVVIPSDYMIERMIDEGMLNKINMANIPNYKYIDERFKNLNFDPKNEYSVPYMWGTVGIIYNTTMVDDIVDSWDILWNEKYSKEIFMLDSQRDSLMVALKLLGYSINTRNISELEEARDLLIAQKPLVLAYVGDEVKDKMIGNEGALAVVWSGDAVYMMDENPDLEYVIPKEGTNLWFDSMVIPASSKNKEGAELFINYMLDPEVAFMNADYIGYATPHIEARKMLDEELTSDRTFYPEPEDLVKTEVFKDLADFLSEYDRIWTEIKAR